MSIAAIMVHVDVERDCEQRVQFALDLADRFQAALIGVAGLPLRPAFAAGGVVIYREPTQDDYAAATARFEEMGKKFCIQGQALRSVEWRTALELPSDLIVREARAAGVILVGPTRSGRNVRDLVEPGAILLRAGRPVLAVPDVIGPLPLRRVVVACKDARECRRAVRDALPFLREANEVLVVEIGEEIRNPRTREIWPTSDVISRATVSLWRMKSGSAPVDRSQPSSWSLSVPRRQT